VTLSGHDGLLGTADDLSVELVDGAVASLKIPGEEIYDQAADRIVELVEAKGGSFPAENLLNQCVAGLNDSWGNPLRVEILNSLRLRVISDGADRKSGTMWDSGLMVELPEKPQEKQASWLDRLRPAETWLERHKRASGGEESEAVSASDSISRSIFCGGQTRLRGADYFWFFAGLMLLTSVAFVPYALWYKPKTWLQDA
jgi:POT family proton-dependent oligopeptide transporter